MVFFDDILIYSRTILEDHLQHVQVVLGILRKNELYADFKNATLLEQESDILGT